MPIPSDRIDYVIDRLSRNQGDINQIKREYLEKYHMPLHNSTIKFCCASREMDFDLKLPAPKKYSHQINWGGPTKKGKKGARPNHD